MESVDTNSKIDRDQIKKTLEKVLSYIGDDPNREGLKETPDRIIRSWDELFKGYKRNPKEILKTFDANGMDEMVILKNCEFQSTCEHHFLPFIGKISIGYIPDGRVIGVSKLARLTEIYARRLQVQERMVSQIADDIMKILDPLGVMVIAEAQHFCMIARGVKKQNSIMVTNAIRGKFKKDVIRNEFLSMIKQ